MEINEHIRRPPWRHQAAKHLLVFCLPCSPTCPVSLLSACLSAQKSCIL